MRLDRQPLDGKQRGEAGDAVLEQHLAFAGTVDAQRRLALRRLHDVERHHAGKHASLAKTGPQKIGIVDAILQADYHGVRPSMGGSQGCHLLRGAALDRHQDHVGVAQRRRRIGGDGERVRAYAAVPTFEIADPQAALAQRLVDARPGQENHPSPGKRKATADIAANAAGAGYGDGFFFTGHAISSSWPATIRHENHNVGGIAGYWAGHHLRP